jgi:serine/threonine-protein kinase
MAEAARAELKVGTRVARKYQLVRLLGCGGMGAVYEAVHEFTQRRVAVKLMHPSFARSGLAAERFLREAQAPSTIGHAGIVEVLDGGYDTDDSLYLVLEYLEGKTLSVPMKAGPMTPQEIGPYVLELLDALGAAHEAGFVHRDIKPDNIFLSACADNEYEVKLLDFGVAGLLTEPGKPGLTVAGSVLGTPLYMSPEQAMGRRVDGRSDLWSVGAVIYQALSGKPPFRGASFQALVVSIATQEHLPLSTLQPNLPVRMIEVVERALQKDLALRWQTAREMADALEHALDHERKHRMSREVGNGASFTYQRPVVVKPHADKSTGVPRMVLAAALGLALVVAGIATWRITRGDTVGAGAKSTTGSPVVESASTAQERREPAAAQPVAPSTDAREAAHTAPPSAQALPSTQPTATVTTTEPPTPTPVEPAHDDTKSAGQVNTLSADELSKVLQAHDRDLQRCYEDHVVSELMKPQRTASPPPGPMRLDVEFDVNPSGAVQRLVVKGETNDALERCVADTVALWRFPSTPGTTEVHFPLVFQPNVVQR